MSRAIVVRRPNAFWWNPSKYLVLGFSRIWFRLRIEGRENFPAEGPVVVVANHSSYLDPPMIGISSPRWHGRKLACGMGMCPRLHAHLGRTSFHPDHA